MAAGLREVGLSVLVLLPVFALAVGGVAASVLLMILGVGALAFAVMIAIAFAGHHRQRHRTAGGVVARVEHGGGGPPS